MIPVTTAAPALASVSNSQNLPPVYSNWPKNPANWPCYATPSYACTQGGYNNSSALASGWPNTYYGQRYASTNSYGMHNCTLYAAYRLEQNGFKDPGNWGDASNWAKAANSDHILVNQTPAAGAIAQWNAGAGGDGHVAYVESVSYNSAGAVAAITITEDNFMPETGYGSLDGGYTAEIHITGGAAVWPANFIHAKDLAPPPSASGPENLLSNASWGMGAWVPWQTLPVNGGTMNWTAYNNSAVAEQGSWYGASNTSTANGSIYQDVAVKTSPGQSYTFSIWIRSTTSAPVSGTVALWGIGGTKESGSTSFTVGSTWTQVSVPLDVAQAGHTKMRAQVYESTTGTTYDFDGAAIH